jgi:hypothetical protein
VPQRHHISERRSNIATIVILSPRSTMSPVLQDTIALLTRTPATLDALLRTLPETLTHQNEGDATWSPIEVLAHLIHGERTDWIERARIIRTSGETHPFPPFDRQGHQQGIAGKTLPHLLDEFAAMRSANLAELTSWHLQPEDLAHRGIHPAFGPVTLSQLLATWATHDLTHLHQISRILAYQYREAVGPWSRYLGVLQCSGHSAPA